MLKQALLWAVVAASDTPQEVVENRELTPALWGFEGDDYETELSAEARRLGPRQTCQHAGTELCRDFGNDCCENGPGRSCSNGSFPVQTGKLCALMTWCYTCAWPDPGATCSHGGSHKCRDNGNDCCENDGHCADGWTKHQTGTKCHGGTTCYRCEPPQVTETHHDSDDDHHDAAATGQHDQHHQTQQDPGDICAHSGSHLCTGDDCCVADFHTEGHCKEGMNRASTHTWCKHENGQDHHCYKCEEPQAICDHPETPECDDEWGTSCCATQAEIDDQHARCHNDREPMFTDTHCGMKGDEWAKCYRCGDEHGDDEEEGIPTFVFIIIGVVGLLICVGCFMALAAFGFMAINSGNKGGNTTVVVEKTAPESPAKPAPAPQPTIVQQQPAAMLVQQAQPQMMVQQPQMMVQQQQPQMMMQQQQVMSPQMMVQQQPMMVQQPQMMQVQGAVVMQ